MTPAGVVALVTVLGGLFLWGGRVETEIAGLIKGHATLAETDQRQWNRIVAQEARISELTATASRIDARTESIAEQLDRIYQWTSEERN